MGPFLVTPLFFQTEKKRRRRSPFYFLLRPSSSSSLQSDSRWGSCTITPPSSCFSGPLQKTLLLLLDQPIPLSFRPLFRKNGQRRRLKHCYNIHLPHNSTHTYRERQPAENVPAATWNFEDNFKEKKMRWWWTPKFPPLIFTPLHVL